MMVAQSGITAEWMASLDGLRGWMSEARAGMNFLLYTGIALPPLHPVVRLAKQWVADGFATLHIGPDPEGGRRWTLQRTAKMVRAAVAAVRPAARSDLDHDAAAVLALLEQAAAAGAACPRLDDMAVATGQRVGGVRAALHRLAQRGLIRIDHYWGSFSRCWRVVRLLDSDASTAPPPPHYRASSRDVLNYEGALPSPRSVA